MDFIFDPSLALYLPLYELGGASFMSRDKHGHLCSVTGASPVFRGYSFDGTDDRIESAIHSVAQISGAFTVEIVIKPGTVAVGNRGTCSTGALSVGSGFGININQNAGADMRGWFYGTDNSWHSTPGTVIPLTTTEFFHLAIVYNLENFKEYANGEFLDESAYTVGVKTNANQLFRVGEDYNRGADYNGIVSLMRVYSRALSNVEIHHNCLASMEECPWFTI